MSSPSSQQNLRLKRKKPPTFQHLPAQRAKKLKRSWVEVQKIKSKWKAQKRKEGLVASRHQSERRAHEPNNRGSGEDPEDEENERASGSSDGSLGGAASEKNGDEVESEESSEDEGPGTPHAHAKSASSKRPNPPKNARNRPQESSSEQPSLRDLQRVAYSPASLHSHKSEPLHRHRGTTSSRGRGGRGGHNVRGRGGGRSSESRGWGGVQRGRGRGQPDMGLRMKAMLEKIKQEFT